MRFNTADELARYLAENGLDILDVRGVGRDVVLEAFNSQFNWPSAHVADRLLQFAPIWLCRLATAINWFVEEAPNAICKLNQAPDAETRNALDSLYRLGSVQAVFYELAKRMSETKR